MSSKISERATQITDELYGGVKEGGVWKWYRATGKENGNDFYGLRLLCFLISVQLIFCLFSVNEIRAHLLILASVTFAFEICEWEERILNRGRVLQRIIKKVLSTAEPLYPGYTLLFSLAMLTLINIGLPSIG